MDRPEAADTFSLIRCDLVDETYGLDMTWVHSIQRVDRLHQNPQAMSLSTEKHVAAEELPPFVGWLPTDEGEVPVFSLANRLGRSSQAAMLERERRRGELQRIIVLDRPNLRAEGIPSELWGLLVDRVSQTISVPADRVTPLPAAVINPSEAYFSGVVRMGEQLILLLSPEWLHPDKRYRTESSRKPEKGSGERPAKEHDAERPMRGAAPDSSAPKAERRGRRRDSGQIVIFSILGSKTMGRTLSFGLSVSQVPEILEPLPAIPVPAAPAFVLGLMNWRDRPVPLIDMADRLGMNSRPARSADEAARLIIARDKADSGPMDRSQEGDRKGTSSSGGMVEGVLAGFLIRPSVQILRLPIEHQAGSRAPSLDLNLARGIVEMHDATLVIPDIGRILKGH